MQNRQRKTDQTLEMQDVLRGPLDETIKQLPFGVRGVVAGTVWNSDSYTTYISQNRTGRLILAADLLQEIMQDYGLNEKNVVRQIMTAANQAKASMSKEELP